MVEDLAPEHVDAAVGEVRKRLRGLRLLLESLDAAVVVRDGDAELGRVLDPLGGDGEDRAALDVGLVRLTHRGQVDGGQGIAGDDQEGIGLAQEVTHLADAARRSERFGLLAVGDPQAEVRPISKHRADLLGQVGEVGHDVLEAVLPQEIGDPGDDRPVQHRRHRLRHHVRERPQPRAQPRRQDHRPHEDDRFSDRGGSCLSTSSSSSCASSCASSSCTASSCASFVLLLRARGALFVLLVLPVLLALALLLHRRRRRSAGRGDRRWIRAHDPVDLARAHHVEVAGGVLAERVRAVGRRDAFGSIIARQRESELHRAKLQDGRGPCTDSARRARGSGYPRVDVIPEVIPRHGSVCG